MEALRRSSHLLLLTAVVVKAAARIPCAAHQNVDDCCPLLNPVQETTSLPFVYPYPIPISFPSALLLHHVPVEPSIPAIPQGVGGGTNQPNVITQSVTWSAKKGDHGKPTATIETDCPMDDMVLESPPKSMKLLNPRGQQYSRVEYSEPDDFDVKIKRLVRLLDNMQKREKECDWACRKRSNCRSSWKRDNWRKKVLEEDDVGDGDYLTKESDDDADYYSDEELVQNRYSRRPKRLKYQRICDCEDVEDPEPPRKRVPMVPKMDWIVLKKSPKRYTKRWMREEDDRRHDFSEGDAARDILYIPPTESKPKCRKRIDDYAR